MAAVVPSSVSTDIASGQALEGLRVLILPFAVNNSDIWSPPTGILPLRVAWEAAVAGDDWVGVSINATTKNVLFSTDGATDPHEGNLIVWYGGAS